MVYNTIMQKTSVLFLSMTFLNIFHAPVHAEDQDIQTLEQKGSSQRSFYARHPRIVQVMTALGIILTLGYGGYKVVGFQHKRHKEKTQREEDEESKRVEEIIKQRKEEQRHDLSEDDKKKIHRWYGEYRAAEKQAQDPNKVLYKKRYNLTLVIQKLIKHLPEEEQNKFENIRDLNNLFKDITTFPFGKKKLKKIWTQKKEKTCSFLKKPTTTSFPISRKNREISLKI